MTTHFEKIQALGNKMVSNLQSMGVSASFNDGGLTLADKILDIQHFDNGILVYSDMAIAQSGDSVNLYALVLDGGVGVANQTVTFKVDGVSIGTATTGSDGVAVKVYSAVGAGLISVTAESSSVVSEPYEVYDCWSYNPCTSQVANYFTFTRCSATYSENGMNVLSDSSEQSNTVIFNRFKNVDTSNNYILEFELKSANSIALRTDAISDNVISTNIGSFDVFNTIRIEYDFANNMLKYYLNGNYVLSKSITTITSSTTLFYIRDYEYDLDITIRNVKIYPI